MFENSSKFGNDLKPAARWRKRHRRVPEPENQTVLLLDKQDRNRVITTKGDKLKVVAGSVSHTEASVLVYSRAKHYPKFISVYIPDKPYRKLKPGYEVVPEEKPKQSGAKNKKEREANLERSIRRTRVYVKDYVLCSEFDLFCTFTFKTDRHDMDKCRAKMSNWLKNQQKRYGKFGYLIIPELHKDGALHFHGLFKNYPGKLTDSGHKTKNGQTIYNINGYRSGFTTAVKIPAEDSERVGNYVRKYITKDMPLFPGKNRYWVSSDLKLPSVEENYEGWVGLKPNKILKILYGTIFYFSKGVSNEV